MKWASMREQEFLWTEVCLLSKPFRDILKLDRGDGSISTLHLFMNIMNDTSLYTLKGLMVNFMLYRFYLNKNIYKWRVMKYKYHVL